VIKRLYVHNFRCLENFELSLGDQSSVLLIGRNGAGKTTVGRALEILQKIARGTNRIADLVRPSDLAPGRVDSPMRIEIQVSLNKAIYEYEIALEFPKGFKELRVLKEKLSHNGQSIFDREIATVRLPRNPLQPNDSEFRLDWHLIALPIVQERSSQDPISVFKTWLSRLLILRPVPSLIQGESKEETLQPNVSVSNFAAWFAGLLAEAPSAYSAIDSYLKQVMPDLRDLKNPMVGVESRNLLVHFGTETEGIPIPFEDLSDGEKCFMICSLVIAARTSYRSTVCFWDEPDNHLDMSEVGHFVSTLRATFKSGGQFIATSHNAEAVRRFSDDNTFVLHRKSHLEPTIIQPLSSMQVNGDLISALVRGDLAS
jgi:predicted ATPase